MSEDILRGKIALITGAGGGIGSAIAKKLAAHKMKLVLLGRSEEKLRASADACDTECLLLPGDLADSQYRSDVFQCVKEHFGGLDILINNAGMTLAKPFYETTDEEFDRLMTINAKVPFQMCRDALKMLKCSNHAAIVNITSVVAHKGYPLQSIYAASKHALAGFSKALAAEVYKDNIRVHLISPGGVFTDMVKISRPDLTGEDMIMPEDIAQIVEFLIANRTNAVIDEISVHRSGKAPFA